MKDNMKNLILLLSAVLLIGCNDSGSSSSAPAQAVTSIPTPAPATTPTPVPTNDPAITSEPVIEPIPNPVVAVSLTLHTKAFSEAPVNGWPAKTYTSKGICTEYDSKTYCWDDGVKVLQFTSNHFTYGPFNYSFWGFDNQFSSCHGGCQSDLFSKPVLVTSHVESVLTSQKIDDVVSTGSLSTVTCSLKDAVLDCVDFKIDLNQ